MTTTAPRAAWTRRRVVRWAVLGLVALGVAIAGGLWYSTRAGAAIDVSTRSFAIHPRSAELTFDVTKPASKAVVCDVRARALDSTVLGRVTGVRVPARTDGARVTTLHVTVPTSAPATVVEVEQCVTVPS